MMNIRRILGIWCWLTKHKRGRQVGMDILNDKGVTTRTYRCDRCGRTHSRRIKP